MKEAAVVLWWLLRLPPHSAARSSASPPPSQPPVAPAARSSKTSLGFISTPLIWPVRKKPETAVTQTPKYAAIYVTKAPPIPTKSMADVSPEALTNGKNLTTGRPTYSRVLWPHNQTEKSFPVASVSMRKNKPLPLQWDLSESTENSSEELEVSVFGSDSLMYDIDFDENLYSLFEFEASYSLDEGLATTSPNTSLLEKESAPTSTDKAALQQTETQKSKMLIKAPGRSDVQMDQSGLDRQTGHTAGPPSISKPSISTTLPGSMSTVHWDLPEVTGTLVLKCIFTGCISVSDVLRPTHTAHGQTETLEEQYTVPEITPSITASLKYSSDYIPDIELITEPLTVVQVSFQSSFPLRAEAPSLMDVQRGVTISPSQTLPFGISESFLSSGADQSNVDSLQRQQASHGNPNPTPYTNPNPSPNPNSNPNPNPTPNTLEPPYSQGDQWSLSYSVNISVSGGSSAQLLTDRWSISPSSPLNSRLSTQMDFELLRFSSTERINNYFESSFISSSVLLDALKATEGVNISEEGVYTVNQTAVSHFTVSLPSLSLSQAVPPDLQSRPFVSEGRLNDLDDSQERSVMLQLSNLLADESAFASQSQEDSGESTTEEGADVSASSFLNTRTYITSRPPLPINPTRTYGLERTVSVILGGVVTEPTGTNTLTILPSKLLSQPSFLISSSIFPMTPVLSVNVPLFLPKMEDNHMSGFPLVTNGFHVSTFPSRQSWPSTLEASVHSLGLDIHPVDTSFVSEDVLDTKHAQFLTTEQLFWSKNESAKPSSNTNNVLIVPPITTDREMHPSPPAAHHSSFVSTNGTFPLASPPQGVVADLPAVPTGANHGSATESSELIPCPCKTLFYTSCHCGLSPGNSMFSNNAINLRRDIASS